MKTEKKIRIGELANALGVEKFVIRFWEKEFNLQKTRSEGGQRFYTFQDLKEFKTIKTLLYEEKFTISGAKKYLEKKGSLKGTIIGSKRSTIPSEKVSASETFPALEQEYKNKLRNLKQQLILLKERL